MITAAVATLVILGVITIRTVPVFMFKKRAKAAPGFAAAPLTGVSIFVTSVADHWTLSVSKWLYLEMKMAYANPFIDSSFKMLCAAKYDFHCV